MAKEIVLLDADEKESAKLTDLLKNENYRSIVKNNSADLDNCLKKYKGKALLINSDTISVTNRSLRELKGKYPALAIMLMSSRPFHPELKEALGSHVYACLTIPIEPDEIYYLLNSIHDNEVNSN